MGSSWGEFSPLLKWCNPFLLPSAAFASFRFFVVTFWPIEMRGRGRRLEMETWLGRAEQGRARGGAWRMLLRSEECDIGHECSEEQYDTMQTSDPPLPLFSRTGKLCLHLLLFALFMWNLGPSLGASRYDICQIFGFFFSLPLVRIWNCFIL